MQQVWGLALDGVSSVVFGVFHGVPAAVASRERSRPGEFGAGQCAAVCGGLSGAGAFGCAAMRGVRLG